MDLETGGPAPLQPSSALPRQVNEIILKASSSWLRNTEVEDILGNYKRYRLPVTSQAPVTPGGGTLFLINRSECRRFRNDGHNWKKKADGKTVKETHEKLKVGNVDILNCYYAHCQNDGLQRRCYWLLEEEQSHIVLAHYLNVDKSAGGGAAPGGRAARGARRRAGGATSGSGRRGSASTEFDLAAGLGGSGSVEFEPAFGGSFPGSLELHPSSGLEHPFMSSGLALPQPGSGGAVPGSMQAQFPLLSQSLQWWFQQHAQQAAAQQQVQPAVVAQQQYGNGLLAGPEYLLDPQYANAVPVGAPFQQAAQQQFYDQPLLPPPPHQFNHHQQQQQQQQQWLDVQQVHPPPQPLPMEMALPPVQQAQQLEQPAPQGRMLRQRSQRQQPPQRQAALGPQRGQVLSSQPSFSLADLPQGSLLPQLSLELSKLSNLDGSFLSGFLHEMEAAAMQQVQQQGQQQGQGGGAGAGGGGKGARRGARAPSAARTLSRQSSGLSRLLQQLFESGGSGGSGAGADGSGGSGPSASQREPGMSWLKQLEGALSALPAASLPAWQPDLDIPAMEKEGVGGPASKRVTRRASAQAAAQKANPSRPEILRSLFRLVSTAATQGRAPREGEAEGGAAAAAAAGGGAGRGGSGGSIGPAQPRPSSAAGTASGSLGDGFPVPMLPRQLRQLRLQREKEERERAAAAAAAQGQGQGQQPSVTPEEEGLEEGEGEAEGGGLSPLDAAAGRPARLLQRDHSPLPPLPPPRGGAARAPLGRMDSTVTMGRGGAVAAAAGAAAAGAAAAAAPPASLKRRVLEKQESVMGPPAQRAKVGGVGGLRRQGSSIATVGKGRY